MKYLLDTCTISEISKETPHPAVDAWFQHANQEDMHLSVLTLGELEKGIQKLPEGKKKHALTTWARDLADRFRECTLPIDELVANAWGLFKPKPKKKAGLCPLWIV